MTNPRKNSSPSKNHAAPPISLEADPSLMRMGNDTDYEHPEKPQPMHPHEFIVTTGANSITFVSGLKISLDSVIQDENRTYDHCVRTFHEELAAGRREPGDTLAEMIGGEDTGLADLTIWGCGGRVAAVLVAKLDGSGYHVTKFNKDRSHPGPIVPVVKDHPDPQPKPGAPWRSFKVDRLGGGFATIVEGHGKTLGDAVAEAAEEIRMLSVQGLEPDGYVVVEQDRVVCHVRAADVLSEQTWTEACHEEDEAIAKAAKSGADPVPVALGVISSDTLEPKPYSPADLPKPVLSLARLELRDAIDALLSARHRVNEAHNGMAGLDDDAKRMVKTLDRRAYDTCTDSEDAIAKSLLTLWGIYDGEPQSIGATTPPWTPCGALVDNRYFTWVVPGEIHGRPDYRVTTDRIRVVDAEALEEDNLTDDDWESLLSRPPCRYVVLHGSKPPVVVDPECHTWH